MSKIELGCGRDLDGVLDEHPPAQAAVSMDNLEQRCVS